VLIRMLITLVAVISLLSLATEVLHFIDNSIPCTDLFIGPAWGNALLWTVLRLIKNYVAIFYSLYLFWMRRVQEEPRLEEDSESEIEESMEAMEFRREDNKSETSLELSPRHSLISGD